MAGESTFSAQITNLVGGATIDEEFCDDAAQDACKEIINQLPEKLKIKCSTVSLLNNSSTTMDLDAVGDILHVTRLSANSGGFQVPCREIPAQFGGLATDSNDLNYYGTASDPVYWVASNTSDVGTLFVKPDPEATQVAYVHHISYPTVDVSASTVEIANFPDEATYLVVLYAAARQLLKFQSTMTASWNSDITTALTAVNTALNRINTHAWVNEETFLTANSQLKRVKGALDNAESVINGNKPSSDTDAYGALAAEDLELMSGALSIASTEISRAQTHLSEWGAIGNMAVQEASGFTAEASARLQQDTAKYQWYVDQHAKLTAEYQRGLAALIGGKS